MPVAIPLQHANRLVEAEAPGDLLERLLREQQLTAVDKFSQWHEKDTPPLQARHYRDLLPLSMPGAGQQYAFDVDLDACSGCKACVVACHALNGLEEDETWRSVGLLHGGTSLLPVVQHVTTACHHCLEPACLDGCPVEAYEKDPYTGIVRHLDDQCIGCQYCILKCPYDVPKYSRAKGIVRKCDMCSGRLAVGEAPACVQSCPNRAIRIAVVNLHDVAENAEANLFLPGSPEPGYTLPATVYKTKRPLPANLLPADYYSAAPQHAHWPLVLMLVLTQMSVGAFLVDRTLHGMDLAAGSGMAPATRTLHLGTAFVLGTIGLAASIFHLGRPWRAYRAVIGWRTSWLSREVLCFGAFAASASAYAANPWLAAAGLALSPAWERALGSAVALSGLAGVASSTMVYASTRRAFWNAPYTGLKFLLTALVLGIPVALLIRLMAAAGTSSGAVAQAMQSPGKGLCLSLAGIVAIKLFAEASIFAWLRARTFTPLRRTAMLMSGALARATKARFAAGALGGVALPALLGAWNSPAESVTVHPAFVVVGVLLVLALNLAGELLERYLFFAAVVAPKMPGAPAS